MDMRYLKKAMKALKTAAAVGAAATMISTTAEAGQRGQAAPRTHAPVQRAPNTPIEYASPRGSPRPDWRQHAVDVRGRSFDVRVIDRGGFHYYAQFYNGAPGFFYGFGAQSFWVPDWCFPGISYGEARARQYWNEHRFGYPVGAWRFFPTGPGRIVYNMWGQPDFLPGIQTEDNSPVIINMGDGTVNYRPSKNPVASNAGNVEGRDTRHDRSSSPITFGYDGIICSNQYQTEIAGWLNGYFDRKGLQSEFHAYADVVKGRRVIRIDGPQGAIYEDFSTFGNRDITGPEAVTYAADVMLRKLGMEFDPQISTTFRSHACTPLPKK